MCWATYWSKLTSSSVAIATAVMTMIAPSVRCSAGPRPARRMRSNRLRPPSVSASSTTPGAERVGDRHRDGAPRRRADRDDGRQDRSGAGGVDEPERGADEQPGGEPVAARVRAEARQPRHTRLQAVGEPRHDQRQAGDEQHRDGEIAQRVRAEADAADDLGDADDRDRERDDQPEHDPQRSAPAADPAGRQQRGQHRQHARGQRGAGPGEDGEPDQDDHLFRRLRTDLFSGRRFAAIGRSDRAGSAVRSGAGGRRIARASGVSA